MLTYPFHTLLDKGILFMMQFKSVRLKKGKYLDPFYTTSSFALNIKGPCIRNGKKGAENKDFKVHSKNLTTSLYNWIVLMDV